MEIPLASELKRGSLSRFSPLKKGGAKGLKTRPRLGAFLHIFLDLQHFFTRVANVCSGGALAFERGVAANRIISEIVLPKDSII
jgi:hypothetical protein